MFKTTKTTMLGAFGALVLASSSLASGGKGLTFGFYSHDPALGVDNVGIAGTGNPYTGDTLCKLKLPILCVSVDGSARPNYDGSVGNGEFYNGWVEGHLQTTLPVKGKSLTSEATGDKYCAAAFGPGWRMAEFHDGAYTTPMNTTTNWGTPSQNPVSPWQAGYPHGGWTFWGFGNVNPNTRYWVAVNDQPGNCWNP